MPKRISLEPYLSEAIANQLFDFLDELEEVLFQRCKVLSNKHDLIRGLTCYHWSPQTNSPVTVYI